MFLFHAICIFISKYENNPIYFHIKKKLEHQYSYNED